MSKEYRDIDKKTQEAIDQIEEKKYEQELKNKGYENIIKYGIAFCDKECKIKKAEN